MRELGVLLPSADTRELERTISALFGRFGGVAVRDLQAIHPRELREFAIEFGDTIRALPFQLPENFLLVVRAVSLISGLSSTLDPDFNIWDAIEPYADRLLQEERRDLLGTVAREAVSTVQLAARLPRRVDDLLTRIDDGELEVEVPRVDRSMRRVERAVGRVVSAVLFAGLLIAGVLLRGTDPVGGTVLMALSVLPLLHAIFGGILANRRR